MSNRPAAIAREALLWLITIFLAWVFLRQGYAKFSDDSGWAKAFRAWHYPDWFRILIGVVEVSAVVLMFIRRLAFYGAILIVVVMLGGMATHIWWKQPRYVTSEVLPLVLASVVAVGRRPKR
ncbi:MAG TPA: DoxX family protein [Thermoanaerobaculia bacterium]|nr:DoxX family protein [Thermoanaerobaculia bacterium]